MASPTTKTVRNIALLTDVASQMAQHERDLAIARKARDDLFMKLHDEGTITVTEMARITGLRRESVHEVIRKRKEGSNGRAGADHH